MRAGEVEAPLARPARAAGGQRDGVERLDLREGGVAPLAAHVARQQRLAPALERHPPLVLVRGAEPALLRKALLEERVADVGVDHRDAGRVREAERVALPRHRRRRRAHRQLAVEDDGVGEAVEEERRLRGDEEHDARQPLVAVAAERLRLRLGVVEDAQLRQRVEGVHGREAVAQDDDDAHRREHDELLDGAHGALLLRREQRDGGDGRACEGGGGALETLPSCAELRRIAQASPASVRSSGAVKSSKWPSDVPATTKIPSACKAVT